MCAETVTTREPSETADKLDFKQVLPIFVVVMVDLLGLTIIIPLLPLYAASFQVSPLLIGALNAVYPFAQLIAAPILGRLSDRFGRKPVLIASQIGTLVGFLILGFANSFLMLLVSRLIDGFSGGNIATAQAMMTDRTTEKTRTQGLGLIGAAFGLGFTVGPVIAFTALAISGNNYRAPAFIAAFFSLASLLLSIFWLQETQDPTHRNRRANAVSIFNPTAITKALVTPQVGFLFMLAFAQHFAFGGLETVIPLFNVSRLGLNAAGNALVFVFVGIIIVVVQGGLIGRWSRRWGERKLIFAGLALLTVALVMIATTPAVTAPWYSRSELQAELHTTQSDTATTQSGAQVTLPADGDSGWLGLVWILAAMVPAAVGGGILQPSINSLITKRTPPEQHGEMLGTSAAMVSAANVLAPLVGYALFQAIGISTPFWLWAAMTAVLFVLAVTRLKPGREANDGQAAAP